MHGSLFRRLFPIFLIGALTWWLSTPLHAWASTLVVNTTSDVDDGRCDSHCSLHEAINAANANPGPDEIVFLFREGGIHTLDLETPLPFLQDDGTTIDGTRSPYWGGIPLVVLDFSAQERGVGLRIPSDDNIIRGLSIVGMNADVGDAIRVEGSRNRIEGNYLGVEPSGAADGNKSGLSFSYSGTENIALGNLISGNEIGIEIYSRRQFIIGNVIGLNAGGTAELGEQGVGIDIYSDNNIIGGDGPGRRNIISGMYTGISIRGDADFNQIKNNYIGTNAEGTAAVPNTLWGISVSDSTDNVIGGDEPGHGNLISGNGVGISACTNRLFIRGNKIGTDASGLRAIPNQVGIEFGCRGEGSQIGAGFEDARNIIAFNTTSGIETQNAKYFSIVNNTIARNGGDGISLSYFSSLDDGTNITITQNSIYDNGGLGISLTSERVNRNLAPPEITTATGLYASGTACPGCRIELFLAAADPSGFGEGKTFLAAANTLEDGTFMIRYADIGSCEQITATATDALGNTSGFSRTLGVGFCVRLPALTAWVIVFGGAGAGSAFMLVLALLPWRPRRRPGITAQIGLGLMGGLLGAGLAIGLLALPVVRIQRPQEQGSGQIPPSATACGRFIDGNTLQPEAGEVFATGTDVLFELSPQPDPPGMQTRWFLEVTGPDLKTQRKLLASNSIPLSGMGFDPRQTGVYLWTLEGERLQTGANIWTPLCRDGIQRMFRIAQPQPGGTVVSQGFTPTATATPTETLLPSTPTATLRQTANCRRGAGTDYEIVCSLPEGLTVTIVGRNPDSSWWQVQAPGTQTPCWVAGENVDTSGDVSGVPVVESPLLGCWVKQQQGPDKCVAPCPQGAQPGGACEP